MNDYLGTGESEGFKNMRKQLKKQQEQIDQLLTQNTQLMAERNASSVADTLASSGLDPRVAKFYPQGAPTDAESVAKWVDENKDYFGNRRVVDSGSLADDTLTDAERRGYQTIQDMAAYDNAVQMDLKSRLDKIEYDPMNPDKAKQELLATLKEFEGYLNM